MIRTVILQEYVPQYRVPFFDTLTALAKSCNIQVEIYAGNPSIAQAKRGDDAKRSRNIRPLRQREFSAFSRRVTVRSIQSAVRDADLVVLEQARRNIDIYRLLLPRATWYAPRIALWGHGQDYVQSKSFIDRALMKLITKRATHFFAYTEGGAERVVRDGVDASKVTVVQNSLDTRELVSEIHSLTSEQIEGFRQAYGLSEKLFLYMGGLDTSKRIDFLLRSFAMARAQDPELTLLVAGEGVDRALVHEAAEHGGVVPIGRADGRTKALCLVSSIALAIPGRVGLVAVDSIASRRPIVTTDWPFHAPEFEYLTPGRSVIVSGDSPAEYADRLVQVARNPDGRDRLSRELGKLAKDMTIETMANNFLRGIIAALPPEKRTEVRICTT